MIRCKECASFKRGKWVTDLDGSNGNQNGGYCKVILKVLGLTNINFRFNDTLYVLEDFGCIMGKQKD
jgi:hypothetical protein